MTAQIAARLTPLTAPAAKLRKELSGGLTRYGHPKNSDKSPTNEHEHIAKQQLEFAKNAKFYTMRDLLYLFRLLAPFAILAAIPLALVLWVLSLAELDVKDKGNDMSACEDVRVVQAAAIANMPICKPIKGKFRRITK